MKILASPPFDPARASFQTHLNYAKRMGHILSGSRITVTAMEGVRVIHNEKNKFRKLYDVTRKSIEKDVELAREDSAFAVIAAPWFPVKCYYALYYLESILIHLLDGSTSGFLKGGHTAIRKKFYANLVTGSIVLSAPGVSRICMLEEVQRIPAIESGRNARSSFWKEEACSDSILKKLADYKLHDAKLGRKWNLHTRAHQIEKAEFIARERIALLDFFYWYRIKANYRDLDYIDFENGITADEVRDYMEAYNVAYEGYRSLLISQIDRIGAH
jgi:hypothetical protein